jgi:hypothetical protein
MDSQGPTACACNRKNANKNKGINMTRALGQHFISAVAAVNRTDSARSY